MRRVTAILSATTAIFAASTVYFATHGDEPAIPKVAVAQGADKLPVCANIGTDVSSLAAPGPAETAKPLEARSGCSPHRARLDRVQAEAQAKYLAQLRVDLADPRKRAGLIEQGKRMQRAADPRLAHYMNLDEAQFEAFITLLAEQNLVFAELSARCPPDCKADAQTLTDRKNEALRDLLGEEGSARYARYEQTRMERNAVDSFRAGLPDRMSMNDDQYEQFITVLADERQKFEHESTSRGLRTNGMGGLQGMLYWDENQHTVEERLAAARQYADRLQARAAAVLTPEQLKRYTDAQEASLANMESMFPWQDAIGAGNPTAAN